MLAPGKVVVVEHLPKYKARIGVILETIPVKANPPSKLRVLILTSEEDLMSLQELGFEISTILDEEVLAIEEIKQNFDTQFGQMLYFSHPDLVRFQPELSANGAYFSHTVIEVEYNQILELIGKQIRVDYEIIMSDIRKRDSPRFA